MLNFPEKKHRERLGFSPYARVNKTGVVDEPEKCVFRCAGFIYPPPEANAIIEDGSEEVIPNSVTEGWVFRNWTIADVLSVIPMFK